MELQITKQKLVQFQESEKKEIAESKRNIKLEEEELDEVTKSTNRKVKEVERKHHCSEEHIAELKEQIMNLQNPTCQSKQEDKNEIRKLQIKLSEANNQI